MEVKAPAPEGEQPYYEVKDGKVFLEGVDVTHLVRPEGDEEEPEGQPDNPKPPEEPALEGEGEEPEKPAKPEKSEPEKKEEPAPEEKPEEPETPQEPEKWKFKLKFRGNEEEVEWDREAVQHRLSKLRAFEENEKEFWAKRREVDPYHTLVKSDWFKEKLKEAYESGELEKPVGPPPPAPRVQAELIRRRAESDYDEVVSALQTYALEMGPEYAQLVDGDAETFLSEYDRVAKERRDSRARKETPKEEPKKPTADELRKELARKEAAKTRASVTKPGNPSEPVSELKRWESRRRELERALRDPSNGHLSLDLTAQLLMHMDAKPAS